MGEAHKADTYVPPAEASKNPPADAVKAMTDQSRQGVTRASATEPEKAQRPAWLPEKFKNEEEFAKAYTELEKKLHGQKPAEVKPADAKPTDKPAETKPEATPEQKAAEQAAQKADLDVKALEAEYAQAGKLSEASLKALADAGFSKEIVDAHIAGLEALREKFHGELHAIAGGQQRFDEMWQWGEHSLSDAEKVALNKTLDSGDQTAIKMAFQGLHSKWSAAGQNEPARTIHGTSAGAAQGDIYTHRDEILKDMRNPEYNTNEAFRMKVFEKIKRSNVW